MEKFSVYITETKLVSKNFTIIANDDEEVYNLVEKEYLNNPDYFSAEDYKVAATEYEIEVDPLPDQEISYSERKKYIEQKYQFPNSDATEFLAETLFDIVTEANVMIAEGTIAVENSRDLKNFCLELSYQFEETHPYDEDKENYLDNIIEFTREKLLLEYGK